MCAEERWVELTVVRRKVVDDRPLVRLRPSVPVEFNSLSSIDINEVLASSCALVASNITAAITGWLNETKVLVERVPASGHGSLTGRVVEPDRIRTGGPFTIDTDTTDEAVCRDELRQASGEAEEGGNDSHAGDHM